MFSCKATIRLVSEQLDHELSFWSHLSMSLHLLVCRDCTRYAKQIIVIDTAIREHYRADGSLDGWSSVPPSKRLADDALDRIKTSLRSASRESESQNDM